MAIVKMNKLSVIGMIAEKQDLIKSLMDLGIIEITGATDKLQDEDWAGLVTKDGDEDNVAVQDKELTRAANALEVLDKYTKSKKPLFVTRKAITRSEFDEKCTGESKFRKETDELLTLNDRYNQATVQENQATAQIQALTPWLSYDYPLERQSTDHVSIKLGVFPPDADLVALSAKLEEEGYANEITELNRDKQQCYSSVLLFKSDEEQALEILKLSGFTNPGLTYSAGTVAENIKACEEQLALLSGKKEEILKQIQDKACYKEDLEFYHDMLTIKRDEGKIRSSMLNTEKTFTFDGWVPVADKERVERALNKYTCWYEFNEPADDDVIPVQMKHNKFNEPMEFITSLYSLPSAREVDPTSIFTMFYIVFFGMMFADVGYGVILFVATLFAIKHYKLYEGGVYQLMKVLNYCGVSSAVFGVLFGSYFGDLVAVVSDMYLGKEVVIRPLWLDPVGSSMTLLVISCALGVIHLFVGMGIKAYEQIKDGDVLGAINDNFVWYVVVIGLVMWLFGGRVAAWGPTVGKWMTIAGFAGAIIIPIFQNKGIGKALGLWNIYSGVTGNLSDILSYSRLLGLGLASASIAQVVNFLASLVGGGRGVVGVILFIVIEIFGHLLNFAINALGSFVHSARLQYVEFFGRFFEGGGVPFAPFGKETKYVRIIEEGK